MKQFNRLLNLLYPPNLVCPLCNNEGTLSDGGICPDCMEQLIPCTDTFGISGPLDDLAAGLIYNDAVKGAMHRFKYKGQVWLAPFFAGYMRIPAHWQADCIAPVPLFWLKRLKRTFNQSEDLARLTGEAAAVPVRTDLLKRVRYTRQQARLSASARKANVAEAFWASSRAAGLSIILVDDVATTHSTLYACAEALKRAGAEKVYGLTACIADRGRAEEKG